MADDDRIPDNPGLPGPGTAGNDGHGEVARGLRDGQRGFHGVPAGLGHDGARHAYDPVLWMRRGSGQRDDVAGLRGHVANSSAAEDTGPANYLAGRCGWHRALTASAAGPGGGPVLAFPGEFRIVGSTVELLRQHAVLR